MSSRPHVRDHVRSVIHGEASPLLDQFPGAVAAFSTRLLRSGHTGELYTLSGSDVTDWHDQSGEGHDATDGGTAARRPTLVGAGLDFDGASNYLSGPHTLATDDVLLAYVVVEPDDATSRQRMFADQHYVNNSNNGGFNLEIDSGTAAGVLGVVMDNTTPSTVVLGDKSDLSTGQKFLVVIELSGGVGQVRVNGQLSGSSGSRTMRADTGALDIGAATGSAIPFDGRIYEAVIYNSDQSANLAAIEAEVMSAWGISA